MVSGIVPSAGLSITTGKHATVTGGKMMVHADDSIYDSDFMDKDYYCESCSKVTPMKSLLYIEGRLVCMFCAGKQLGEGR